MNNIYELTEENAATAEELAILELRDQEVPDRPGYRFGSHVHVEAGQYLLEVQRCA